MPNANTFLPPAITIPGALVITAISNAFPMAVSFTNSQFNTYIAGQLVRLNIPRTYGMQQAAGNTYQIVTVDDIGFIFYLLVDSTNFDLFIVPSPGPFVEVPATLSPGGSRNVVFSNSSTLIPFQNLSNEGN